MMIKVILESHDCSKSEISNELAQVIDLYQIEIFICRLIL